MTLGSVAPPLAQDEEEVLKPITVNGFSSSAQAPGGRCARDAPRLIVVFSLLARLAFQKGMGICLLTRIGVTLD